MPFAFWKAIIRYERLFFQKIKKFPLFLLALATSPLPILINPFAILQNQRSAALMEITLLLFKVEDQDLKPRKIKLPSIFLL